MRETGTAVVAGHICLDVIPDLSSSPPAEFETRFVPGQLLIVGPATFSTGGAVPNTGLALHTLGIPTQLVAKLGQDLFGDAIRQIIAAHGARLAETMVVDEAEHTSYTIVINYPGADRIFLHNRGANDSFRADDVRLELLERATLFHFGYPPLLKRMYENDGAELASLFRRAKQTGITTSLDMAVPDPDSAAGRADWTRILERTLPHTDVFMPSIQEILFMLRRKEYTELQSRGGNLVAHITPVLVSDVARQLVEMGVKIAALKLGERGLYLRTAGRDALEKMGRAQPSDLDAWTAREFWAPCFSVQLVSAVGSGDATIAGFLAALLRDFGPAEALTAAVAVGACNVEAADALTGIRAWDETLARIARGWARHPLSLDAPGWEFDAAHGLWCGPCR